MPPPALAYVVSTRLDRSRVGIDGKYAWVGTNEWRPAIATVGVITRMPNNLSFDSARPQLEWTKVVGGLRSVTDSSIRL